MELYGTNRLELISPWSLVQIQSPPPRIQATSRHNHYPPKVALTLYLTHYALKPGQFFRVCGKRAAKLPFHGVARHFAHLCQHMPIRLEGERDIAVA